VQPTPKTNLTGGNGRQDIQNVLPYLWDADNPLGYGNRLGRYRTNMESDFLFGHLGEPPQRILDMGGGSGRFGGALAAQGHHVTLIDKNPQAVALAQERGVQRAIACDISDFQESGFDCVVCMEVIQYFEDCAPIIAKASQSLKTGGTFVFCVTNSRSWRFRLRALKGGQFKVNAYTIKEIEQCLEGHDFEIAERKGFHWSVAQTGSDSFLVDVSALIEKSLGLQKWLSQSPWLLYACKKTGGGNRPAH
jgi:2-polyprenyl-3-methyl-5-hydroxy-6-metoxy-1,4-benzoquinol methylase